MTANFVRGYSSDDGRVISHHRDGIPWHDAPIPRRWHRCQVQTYAFVNYFTFIERCACGAIRMENRSPWMDRNSRRKEQAKRA